MCIFKTYNANKTFSGNLTSGLTSINRKVTVLVSFSQNSNYPVKPGYIYNRFNAHNIQTVVVHCITTQSYILVRGLYNK